MFLDMYKTLYNKKSNLFDVSENMYVKLCFENGCQRLNLNIRKFVSNFNFSTTIHSILYHPLYISHNNILTTILLINLNTVFHDSWSLFKMPTLNLKRDLLFQSLGQKYSEFKYNFNDFYNLTRLFCNMK